MTERARILMVDDRPTNLLALEAILTSVDHTLVRANSGEEALRELLKDDYALILLDAQMPGMDGFETAARIRARSRTRDVPIIFLTAADHDQRNSYRGYAAGGVDYISKPFDPWLLRAKVQVFVDLWVARQRLSSQATLLRRQIDDEQGADGLGALLDRVDELTRTVEQLQVAAEAGDLSDVRIAVPRIREVAEGLRRSLAALEIEGTAAQATGGHD